jgi:hypothetical protein
MGNALSNAKLKAWADVRAYWKACKCKGICDGLLDAEYNAENVD